MWPPLSRTTPLGRRSCRTCRGCRAGRSPRPARRRRDLPAAFAAATRSCQSRSRPDTSCASRLRALQDQAGIRLGARELDRLVEQRLVGARPVLASTPHEADRMSFGSRVFDAGRQLIRREAAEHHRMDGADAGAGQHGDRRFRDHRHVEDDAVALRDAKVLEHGAEHCGLRLQLRIGERALRARDGAVVDDRRLPAPPGRDVAVDGIVAGVAERAGEPAAVDARLRIEDLLGGLEPVDLPGRLRPEARPDRPSSAHRPRDSG